ncbi:ATP-binding protein, partial [Acinetobacter baumannii]
QDQLENIFIVFRRLHAEDTYPGTGMGLTIARKAARLLGGNLSAASEGHGSRFILRLPVVPIASP